MAEIEEKANEMGKPTESPSAPEEAKSEVTPVNPPEESPEPEETPAEVEEEGVEEQEGAEEVPSVEDLSTVIELLNEVDQLNGGNGGITDLPASLAGSVKYIVEKMVALRDAFEDPKLKAIIDDMVDQKEDGATPSAKVAVARVFDVEELQEIADSEDYASAQAGVEEGLAQEAEKKQSENDLYAKFDESKANIDAYVEEMGYNEDESGKLYERIAKLRDIFADGLITKEEVAEIDKIDKYDGDIAALRSQLPQEPTKEVLPDRASMEEQVAQTPKKQEYKPRNTIESMQRPGFGGVDVTKVGNRRFTGRS